MSTRTNIIVKHGKTVTYLYRHHDGYLAVTGADLWDKLTLATLPGAKNSAAGAAAEFLRSLLSDTYDVSYDPRPRHSYELTSDLHGDIEHAYWISFKDRRDGRVEIEIRHSERPDWRVSPDTKVEQWARHGGRLHVGLDTFRDAVNADRAAINKRLEELKAKHGGAYQSCEPYMPV